ncbi:polyribonucleotide nucleotidyltransferase [Candidatus Dojkabacteria bacterium]|nr:polyribonucleotide nucleotidyltransferase [Candidatus Dojkabacteria bacterium]
MEKTIDLAGAKLTFKIGKVAEYASASVIGQMGDTTVLVSVIRGPENLESPFFPLTIEYLEKFYASGMISGSRYVKRERFPSTEAILNARMIDRSIRPLFPAGFTKSEVQVMVNVLSYDEKYDPLIVAINTTSLALMISDIPFDGPIAGFRVMREEGNLKITFKNNPIDGTVEDPDHVNIVASSDGEGIVMVDADAYEVKNDVVTEALQMIAKESVEFVKFQRELQKEIGEPKFEFTDQSAVTELVDQIQKNHTDKLVENMRIRNQRIRRPAEAAFIDELTKSYEGKYSKDAITTAVEVACTNILKDFALNKQERVSGRKFDEIRSLSGEVGLIPRVHGSGLFNRGGTQVLSIVTLASSDSSQIIEGMEGEENKRYMHHYNAYPFCYGEAGRFNYMPGRRELGHGALAEKALLPVLPSSEKFPYAIRVVSEVLMSAGSTSMASTCGSTLALMDAGVPIKKHVGGITVGLIAEDDFSKYQLILDIEDNEDHYAKMDFKVTGTVDGITAIQLDNKAKSIPVNVLAEALEVAETGRMQVIDLLKSTIPEPRKELPKSAPRFEVVKINPGKIGELIGPGGKNIKKITEETETDIDIDEDGTVRIFGLDSEKVKRAQELVDGLVGELELNKIYSAKVVKVAEFGVFIELDNGASGLVHVSEMSDGFVKDPGTIAKLGDKVEAKLIKIDETGRYSFSIKQAMVGKAVK